MLVAFDTLNIYYLPQYLPIFRVLERNGHRVIFVCYRNKNKTAGFDQAFNALNVEYIWVDDKTAALEKYLELKPDWIFFGNALQGLGVIHQHSKTAQLGHGIGPKPSYYRKSSTPMTVRFMEGAARLEKIRQLYPNDHFVQVGFSKLDPILTDQEPGLDFEQLGLDPNKPTILYAPTFNPSSLECFPDQWPDDFGAYNILIKAHAFTYTREQYAAQRKKLKKWAACSNTYVADENDVSLLPFMQNADVLLSEASSTLFEFAALNKPVIVCDFFKLKWSYRGPFKYRFDKRFGKDNVLYKEIGVHIQHYKALKTAVAEQLANPQQYADLRAKYTHDHVGPTDGQASQRIVKYLEENS